MFVPLVVPMYNNRGNRVATLRDDGTANRSIKTASTGATGSNNSELCGFPYNVCFNMLVEPPPTERLRGQSVLKSTDTVLRGHTLQFAAIRGNISITGGQAAP